MGLISSHLHILAMEQKKHPIRGDVLTLSQQAIFETAEGVRNILISHGLKPKSLAGIDIKNKIPLYDGTLREKFTNAQTVLSMMGAEKVFSSDVSKYENPDYVIDLNHDVDENFHEKFDFIIDSGTLEHIFDTPTVLSNIARMVKKGGHIMLTVPSSNMIDHGFYSFSPSLFFDFFGANGFSNFACYLIEENKFNPYKKSKLYQYDYIPGLHCTLSSKNSVQVCFFATKNNDINFKKIQKPIQGMYLVSDYWLNKNNKEGAHKKLSAPKKFIKESIEKIEFYTRRFRPLFIDSLYKNKEQNKNLTYLGRF